MRHSTEQLIAVAYQYFPRGLLPSDPAYEQTPERLRHEAVRGPVAEQYRSWRAMVRRLGERFPAERFQGVSAEDFSPFLRVPTAVSKDRCFTGQLWLPSRGGNEKSHSLEFLVSFIVPYYSISSLSVVKVGDARDKMDELERGIRRSFTPTPDEEPFARAVAEEIEATFPGYEPLDPDVGLTVVPDVQAGNRWFGEATIFTCLFSDDW